MDERAERIGLNEALFREVNERVKTINEAFSDILGDAEFVCECGRESCTERISLPLGDYERVRQMPTWFFVKPGHQIRDVEQTVESHDGWIVVKKAEPEAAEMARELDPRH
jgi:hypothetical protein